MFEIRGQIFVFILLTAAALNYGIYITKEECPPNEEYLLCGSSCPFNCSDPAGPVSCDEDCAEGCFCKAGYLRSENGTCVSTDACLEANNTVCSDLEEFVWCGGCTPTCSEPQPDCSAACVAGCSCKSGYVRDEATGKCVTVDQCTPEPCLNSKEVWSACNATCEPSCSDPIPLCPQVCEGGCVCAPGLLRHGADCVAVEKCPISNSTDVGLMGKYLNAVNRILHVSITNP